ncbi:hypothetical protein [Pelomonas aquatica]|uniref:hypothetical protein n=1 Tax=Pelomonas aquatica TaxID=431058 RepID=UPI00227AF83B|nr:hypothetical protein [Pelomonas aquatica]MCY4753578.1 hypothetical protein [Pelomonas aquatica]
MLTPLTPLTVLTPLTPLTPLTVLTVLTPLTALTALTALTPLTLLTLLTALTALTEWRAQFCKPRRPAIQSRIAAVVPRIANSSKTPARAMASVEGSQSKASKPAGDPIPIASWSPCRLGAHPCIAAEQAAQSSKSSNVHTPSPMTRLKSSSRPAATDSRQAMAVIRRNLKLRLRSLLRHVGSS